MFKARQCLKTEAITYPLIALTSSLQEEEKTEEEEKKTAVNYNRNVSPPQKN